MTFYFLKQALIFFKSLTISGFIFACVILIRLLMIGRGLNFMNIMFLLLFASEIICGSFIIPTFFEIGDKNWNDDEPKPDEVMKPCGTWLYKMLCFINFFL